MSYLQVPKNILLSDLLKHLEEVELADAFLYNELKCAVCDDVLDESNVGSITYDPELKGRVSCRKTKCITVLSIDKYGLCKYT